MKNTSSKMDPVKFDVEGHDYECLTGLFDVSLNLNINLIQFETHRSDI
mgnify:CR=1 FL=1|tara:strand:+ start:4028 stop:4171 length:144 start_codon:yes stop_codon:yes gene_type:complete